MPKIRVNMNFEEEILKKVDDEAKFLGVSRTACISFMVSQYLNQKEVMKVGANLRDVYDDIKKLQLEK